MIHSVIDDTGLEHYQDELSEAGGLTTLCDLTLRRRVRPLEAGEPVRGRCMNCADGARRLNPDGSYKPSARR